MTPRVKQVLSWSAATLLLLAMAVGYVWPLPTQLSTHVPGDQRDPLLNAALLDHVFRSLATLRWGAVWDAPIFFPHQNTLAFSESFLGSAWYGVPLWLLTPDPVALHNTFMVAGLFFSGLSATLLGAALTESVAAGLVAGVVYAFGPFHLIHSMHVQMHQAFGAPLGFLGLWWVLRGTRRRGWGWPLAALGMSLQVLACSYLGLFAMALALPVVLVVLGLRGRGLREDLPGMALGVGVAAVLLVAPLSRYHDVSAQLGFKRNIEEIRGFSARPEHAERIPPGLRFPPPGLPTAPNPEESSWPGRLPPPLALGAGVLLALELAVRRLRKQDLGKLPEQVALAAVALGLAWLSVRLSYGPGSGAPTLDRPYSLLLNYVPGFDGLRVPSRFFGLSLLMYGVGAALLAGRLARLPFRGAPVLALGMAAACAVDVWPQRYPAFPLPDNGDMGPVLQAVKESDNPGPLLELPYRLYWRSAQHDLNTTRHRRRTTNGYSGVEPPLGLALRYLLPSFPLSRTDELVRQLGVTALVLHRGPPRADPGERAPFLEEALAAHALPPGFSLKLDRPQGAWLEVEQAGPGPLADLSSLWGPGVTACAAPGSGTRLARVDLPLRNVVVIPVVRHPVRLEGTENPRAVLAAPPVGLLDTLVGSVELRGGNGPARIRLPGQDLAVAVKEAPAGALGAVHLEANLPPQLRSGQGLWLRVQVRVDSGAVAGRGADGTPAGHEVRLALEGFPGEIRPTSLPLRTDAAPGCPGVAEGVVEILKGQGAGSLRLTLVGGGRSVAEARLPLEVR